MVDVARDKRDARANRFAVFLRQTGPLLYNPSFQHLLLKLVGEKEEVEVAKEIQKALKQAPPLAFQATTRPPYQRRARRRALPMVDVDILQKIVGLLETAVLSESARNIPFQIVHCCTFVSLVVSLTQSLFVGNHSH